MQKLPLKTCIRYLSRNVFFLILGLIVTVIVALWVKNKMTPPAPAEIPWHDRAGDAPMVDPRYGQQEAR